MYYNNLLSAEQWLILRCVKTKYKTNVQTYYDVVTHYTCTYMIVRQCDVIPVTLQTCYGVTLSRLTAMLQHMTYLVITYRLITMLQHIT
jgi:hypothetical protein